MADDNTVLVMKDVMTRLGTITNPANAPGQTKYWLNGYFQAYDDAKVFDKLVGAHLPVAAVVYEGMTSHADNTGRGEPKHSHSIGMAANLSFSIIVAGQSDVFGQSDFKTPTMNTLALIRATLRDTTGPSNHFYRFVAEQPAVIKNTVAVWVQRWQIPVILIGSPVPS